MKKLCFAVLILAVFLSFNAYALETRLLSMRNKVFDEAKQIKPLMANSKDVVLINSLLDSCMMTVNQLDAYFSMIGIFNTIKPQEITQDAIDYLISWLNGIKEGNELNIKSLNSLSGVNEQLTQTHVDKLKGYFAELNKNIDSDVGKLLQLKKAAKPRKK